MHTSTKYLPYLTKESVDRLKNDPVFEELRTELFRIAEEKLAATPLYASFTELNLFAETGDRKTFERVLNDYNGRLHVFPFAYLLSEDEKYLAPLADAIWSYCDFESWSLPAHANMDDSTARREHIDLNAASVGMLLVQILSLFEDKLPRRLCLRVHHELRARIIDPFKKYRDKWYYKTENNWASVIAAGVFCVYLYEAQPLEIASELPVLMEMIENYLCGFDDEGCCKEGFGYWNYGFSHFCIFAELLRAYTDGAEDLFRRDKVRAIAHFQENASLDEVHAIPFSDAAPTFSPLPHLTHFLKREYPDVVVPKMKLGYITGNLRFISWLSADIKSEGLVQKSHIFHENQWFIYKSEKYNMACKAGTNGEFHNHNDVGSFAISKNGEVTLADPGAATYTRQYFSKDRYTFVEASSLGHSVPIINGICQNADNDPASRRAEIFVESSREYAFSMEQNYDDPTLRSLRRHFVCEDEMLVLTDTFDFTETPEALVERFVSLRSPLLLEEGRVAIGQSILLYDPDEWELALGGVPRSCSKSGTIEIFFVDFSPKKMDQHVTFRARFL